MRILLFRVLYSGPLFSETPYGFKTLDSKCWYIVSEFRSPKSVQIFGFIADTIIPKFVKCTQPGSLQSAPSLFMGCYTTQSYGSGFEVHAWVNGAKAFWIQNSTHSQNVALRK